MSFILIISNLLRLFWWYCRRFSAVILVAAVVMITCQLVLLYYWVKQKNAAAPRRDAPSDLSRAQSDKTVLYHQVMKKTHMDLDSPADPFANITTDVIRSQSVHVGSTMSASADPFVSSFWYWNTFSSYLICLLCIVCVASVLTTIFQTNDVYIGLLGSFSSGIEVCSSFI